ncbi:WD40 repeat-like protein [Trametes sanguinea]|nr:WD40 repeat-like protein [Trametes sanguinea]
MKYRQVRMLLGTHAQGVTRVSFSPDGSLLASSDLSGKMCIWEHSSGTLLHVYTAGTSILSLLWTDSQAIVCGLADGTLVKLIINEVIQIDGKWCHAHPVEHLALSGSLLAAGAHTEVCVWEISQGENPFLLRKEVESPITSKTHEISVVTGIHWGATRDDGSQRATGALIVTYMLHGIYVYDTQNWTVLRHFGDRGSGLMASSSLSPDGLHIVVANLVNGFDVYDLDTGSIILSLFHTVKKKFPVPVLYVHGGNVILGGSSAGVLDLWYIEGTLSRRMQTLSVPGRQPPILCCTTHGTDQD